MHGTIKSNHNYTHIWVQIIPNVKVTYFLSQRYIHEFDFFFFNGIYMSLPFIIIEFWWFIYIRFFFFYTTLTYLEQKLKKLR